MKPKMIKILFLFCLSFPMVNQAQLSTKVIKSFPAHIIIKIYDVASKIELSEENQLKIGKKLYTSDSLANVSLANGESVSKIKKYYPPGKKFLIGILKPEELDTYLYELDKKNRFLLALKSSTILHLEPQQTLEIRKQEKLLDSLKITDYLQKHQFCNRKLDSILSKKQYASLMNLAYADESKKETDNDWKNIQKLKLVPTKDSSRVYSQLYAYNLEKNSFLDSHSKKFDTKQSTEIKNLIVLEKQPPVLTRYNILSNFIYKLNLFSIAIQYEKELNLNPTQIDSLLSRYRELELMKYKDKEENQLLKKTATYTLYENKAIVTILDPKQLAILLTNKNKKNAIQIAQENWKELEQQGLTNGYDKNSQLQEFAKYNLNFLVASDRLKMNNNPINMFKKRDVELKKPELLKQLDAIKRSEKYTKVAKNQLKW
ncbi:hypothetical protein [Flavobacterium cellulosilyticum]|uniref:DUF4369 domain-containing protein n=1 Tax=Flavobacterium cellulosilyticum TaxID=2541731 RepID=A0A4R5CHM5_9FLAO|nr:hypothetical protein [Flavobacterium cellulosilyticum]TDD98556.1 hypothetical protein E0F76_05355 [Flavobacterium cellulosilyticum]